MAIKQIAYYVPPEIEAGLIKGIYKQFGGVIRNKKTGAIVKHLDEVPIKKDNALIGAVKNHPVATVTIGAVIAGGTAATAYAVKKKKEKEERKNTPLCVIKFEKSLKKYLKAVRKGELDENMIDRLMADLDAMKDSDEVTQISLDLSTKDLKQLVNMIYDYTKKLAKANDVKLDKFKKTSPDYVDYLHSYLEVQKQIFHEVA